MAWLSRNDLSPSDRLYADQLNSLSNDIRTWGGNVNGGGNHLANVILDATVSFPSAQTPWASNIDGAGHDLNNAGAISARYLVNIYASSNFAGIDLSNSTGIRRWEIGKETNPETGANAGSNFYIARCDDTGASLGLSMLIVRATGNLYMAGPVGIGLGLGVGLPYPLNVSGDCNITGTYRVNGVPLSTGGGGAVSSVFSRTGAVVATSADYSAYYVPVARQVLAGTGLTGGGPLTGDVSLAIVADSVNQKVRVSSAGGLIGTRREVNFVNGANVTCSVTDDTANNRVNVSIASTGGGGGMVDPTTTVGDFIVRGASAPNRLPVGTTNGYVLTVDSAQTLGVKWAAPTGGGGGGSQTPWASDIDAAGFNLNNAAMITAKNIIQIRQGASNISRLYFQSPTGVNRWSWSTFVAETGGNVGSEFLLDRFADDGSFLGSALFVRRQTGHVFIANNLGLGVDPPAYKLDVSGDINISAGSSYRINGIPISTSGSGGGPTAQTDRTARGLSTTYQNTGTKPVYSSVVLTVPAGSTTVAQCDAASTPTTAVAEEDIASAAGASVITLFYIVLPNYYHRVVATAGSSIYKWTEWT